MVCDGRPALTVPVVSDFGRVHSPDGASRADDAQQQHRGNKRPAFQARRR